MSGCPTCGKSVRPSRWIRVGAVPFMIAGVVLAIPTVGLSLVVTIYGVFLWKKEGCRDCEGALASEQNGVRAGDVAKGRRSDIL